MAVITADDPVDGLFALRLQLDFLAPGVVARPDGVVLAKAAARIDVTRGIGRTVDAQQAAVGVAVGAAAHPLPAGDVGQADIFGDRIVQGAAHAI